MLQKLSLLLDRVCGLLCAVALLAIMVLTFFDVLGRKFLSHSIPGSLELTELLMVVVIFTALPLVSKYGEHVEFDSLSPYLSKTVQRLLDITVQLIAGCVLMGVSWIMWRAGMEFAASGETSVQLGIPKYPFIYGISLLFFSTSLVHFMLLVQPHSKDEDTVGGAL